MRSKAANNNTGVSRGSHDTYEEVAPKSDSFEQFFKLPSAVEGMIYRIAALNAHRDVLRYSNEIVYERSSLKVWSGLACLLGVSFVGLCYLTYLRCSIFHSMCIRRNKERKSFEYHDLQHCGPA